MVEGILWWITAAVMVVAQDLNLIEYPLIWLGWRYRDRIFSATLFSRASGAWQWLTARPALACILIGAAPILIRLALLPIFPIPEPLVSDEFSHLLLSDTLLHGRLTNPTHPLWTHFESIHIIQRPTYSSNYFPAQAVILWLGTLAWHPWLGVLLVTGLMCGSLVWALQPYMPNRWAVLAGVLAAIRFGITGYWVNSYWGGALGALGGALILGSYGRIRRGVSVWLGLLLGLGFAIIGVFRPFEGLFFALPFAVVLLYRAWLARGRRIEFVVKTLVPAALVVGFAFAGVGVFFHAVTGDSFTPGYTISQKTYGWPLVMPWQKASEPSFRHKEMRQYYEWEKGELEKKDSVAATIAHTPRRLVMGWTFFFGPAISIGLFHLRRVLSSNRLRIIMVSTLVCGAVVFSEAGYPHYFSPATVGVIAIAVQGLRYARVSRIAPIRGRFSVALVLTILTTLVGMHVIAERLHIPYVGAAKTYLTWCCASTEGQARKLVESTVSAHPGTHVILVAYHHLQWETVEWVYNGADIDGSRVIWARDMGPERNRELLDYYPGRQFWIVDADDKPPVVRPYGPAVPAGPTVADSHSR